MRPGRTFLVGIAVAALVATGCEWNFETLDGHQNGPHGEIDGKSGYDKAAILYKGRPHVFYRADNAATNKDVLRHAYFNGSFWAFETLDGVGGPNGRVNAFVGDYTSAILYNGRPHAFYYDADNGNLRHAYWNGVNWAFETLDGAGGPNGRINANVANNNGSAILYGGRPHLFYSDGTNTNLRHAYYNGFAWIFETLDGHQTGPNGQVNGNAGGHASAILYKGRPHVFYLDAGSGNLRHAYWNGVYWAFENLDGHKAGPHGQIDASVGSDTAVILYGGNPRVFYRDYANGDLRLAYYTGSAWGFETLDGKSNGPNGRINADVGTFTTAVSYNGAPHVFYEDIANENLRHAWFG